MGEDLWFKYRSSSRLVDGDAAQRSEDGEICGSVNVRMLAPKSADIKATLSLVPRMALGKLHELDDRAGWRR